jgi:hypothetical protein
MTFPFGLQALSPDDFLTFRAKYEESVAPQPLDDLGQWYLESYKTVESGGFTEALNWLDFVLEKGCDYSGYTAARHLLSQGDPRSAVSMQVVRRLLAHRSPLLVRYGLCLTVSGDALVDRESQAAIARLKNEEDSTTAQLARLAELAMQTGIARRV